MIEILDVEGRMERFFRAEGTGTEREEGQLERSALEVLHSMQTIPGLWHPMAWEEVRITLEQEPNGTWYRGHHVAWVGGSIAGQWVHEVDADADHRFETLAQALLFIDILES
jgi:hypothetical protein